MRPGDLRQTSASNRPAEPSRFADVVEKLATGHQTIGEMVYSVLRESITSGALAPGEWLRQRTLAEAIGVSRIPVRSALMQLEAEGLVTLHPHRGARVRALDARQIDEIYQLRKHLEPYALRLSMAKMTPSRLMKMRELATELDSTEHGDNFLAVRVQFYREVYDAEHNPLLVEMIENLRGHVGRHLLGLHFKHESPGEHSGLVNLVGAGELVAAERWIYTHLDAVQQMLTKFADDQFLDLDDVDLDEESERETL